MYYEDAPDLDALREEYTERDEAVCDHCGEVADTFVHTEIDNAGRVQKSWDCEDCGQSSVALYVWVADYDGVGYQRME